MFVNQCFIAPCLQTLRLQKNDSRLSGLGVLPEMTWEMTLEKTSYKKAQVMLTCHLANACHIPEAVAYRVIRNYYEWQGVDTLTKNPPIVDSTSFRVTKMCIRLALKPSAYRVLSVS